jgi:DNA-binding NarL/FixJ family response regulator
MSRRILLYSDEPILAKGLDTVLRGVPEFDVAPACRTAPELLDRLDGHAVDLLLLDLTGEITFSLLCDLRRHYPAMAIVLWVGNTSRELVSQAEGLGIRGILRKTMPAERQVACLRAVCEGDEWFEKGLTDGPLGVRGVALTRR